MEFFDAIVGAISSVVSGIGGALGAIGGAIGSVLSVGFPPLTVLNTLLLVIAVAKALGIIGEENDPEDMGDRVLQGEKQGITREQFESHEAYMKKLQELDLDEELSKKISREEKLMAAAAVAIMGIEEKTGVKFGSDMKFVAEIARNPEFFTPERVQALIKEVAQSDIVLDKVSEYFDNKGTLSIAEAREVKAALINTEKTLNPNAEETTIFRQLDEIKR